MAKCKQVPLSALSPGVVLRAPITDPHNPRIRLLAEGTRITQGMIDRLTSHGVETVVMSQRDLAIVNSFKPQGRRKKVPRSHHYVKSERFNEFSDQIDRDIDDGADLTLGVPDKPLAQRVNRPLSGPYIEGLQAEWSHSADEQIESIDQFYEEAMEGRADSVGPLHTACTEILKRLMQDQDALVCMACNPYESEYPSRHGLHLASVAMAIGLEMNLDRAHLIDLGVGCLVHDVGMRAVGLSMFECKQTLSPAQLRTLADHPVLAIEIAGRYGDTISTLSRMVAYQIHERCDGSGYPRGRASCQIHMLAKIAGAADAFVGMVSRRPHRLGIQGYYAMAQMLEDMTAGKFDSRVIRSLLHATSLFPLGSMVKINNECVGRVIRSGGGDFVRPTIEMWHQDHMDRPPAIVDLREEPKLRILSSIPASKAA